MDSPESSQCDEEGIAAIIPVGKWPPKPRASMGPGVVHDVPERNS